MKVVVSGASGFLGRHLIPILESSYGKSNVKGLTSKDYDLLNYSSFNQMFLDLQPECFVHLAAYSGGIGANRTYPADFYFKNTILTANGFELAAKHKVKKMVYTMGGCSYPATAQSPIDESQMWNGYPQNESAGYSMAKKMGIVASRSYRTQFGLNSVVLIPGNMYGEFDNFRTEESHVVPAMIRRYFETQLFGHNEITMWGSGSPQRDFVYAGDVAKLIPYFLENYDSSEPVNISTGTTTSIKELAGMIKELVGFKGQILWDTHKPDGQMVKIFDVKKMNSLDLKCSTPIFEGLTKTIQWFKTHYDQKTDGIRL